MVFLKKMAVRKPKEFDALKKRLGVLKKMPRRFDPNALTFFKNA